MKTSRLLVACLAGLAVSLPAASQEWLDKASDALVLESSNGWFRAKMSGLLDLETYYIDQRPPGLIFQDDGVLFNPRLSLFLDVQLGKHLYGFAQARFDRGFDPDVKEHGDARMDEYLLRYTPLDDTRINLQIGKFATTFGNWVQRHESWRNPFITAPLAYENVLGITDQFVPSGPARLLGRKALGDLKAIWLPVIWGPSYASGASVFGAVGKFDYAFEVKNVGLSSRPSAWDATQVDWDYPTLGGRVGYRPNAAWNIGTSFSRGTYLLPDADATLPSGYSRGDYAQTTFGQDINFAWHRWQLWAEVIESRFNVPNVGNADSLSYYLEAKYIFNPRVFAALRWNQQLFGTVPDAHGN
ncbi:MAG TPA: hypothetical protein VHH73_15725, partial [Verrucomicrobiae bacterium]|nr:hypothetical protein [Verrucomicrobiae bacterium]